MGRAGNFASRFDRVLPNPITQILARKDSIALTDSQVVRLTTLRDTLDAKNKRVSDAVKAAIDKAGANPDPGALFGAMRPKLDEGSCEHPEGGGRGEGDSHGGPMGEAAGPDQECRAAAGIRPRTGTPAA